MCPEGSEKPDAESVCPTRRWCEYHGAQRTEECYTFGEEAIMRATIAIQHQVTIGFAEAEIFGAHV